LLQQSDVLASQADPETRMIQVSENSEVPDESDRAHQYTRLVKLYVANEAITRFLRLLPYPTLRERLRRTGTLLALSVGAASRREAMPFAQRLR
jgi:hypothetical protein